MDEPLTFIEAYGPLVALGAFAAGWAVAMLTGMMFSKVA